MLSINDAASATFPEMRRPNPTQRNKAMTAADVGLVVGSLDLEAARRHHTHLTDVGAELAQSAGVQWPWTDDDPTVAVVRAVGRLCLVAPDALSERAWGLCRRLELAVSGDIRTARTVEVAS